MSFKPSFHPGAVVDNATIVAEFKCGNMGGMRRSKTTNTLVIVSDHTKGLYEDKWYGDILHYTGMGKNGDQDLFASQNRTLYEASKTGIEVHLFEVLKASEYIYHGLVTLIDKPYTEIQRDEEGNPRKVWMFPLKVITGELQLNSKVISDYEKRRTKQAQKLSLDELRLRAEENQTSKASVRSVTADQYIRDPFVSDYAKRRANGKCQLCKEKAPFLDREGKPYLETHHIVWLSKGGADTIENTVALCPNCHRKVHVLDLVLDRMALR